MNSNPKISVIVPVYRVERCLDRCVESIVNQTYKNLEIILVDDGSPNNCPAMCDAWAEKDERIRVIHKENGGLSDARNAGMDIATGDYIGFVDSDDWIEPDMYEILIKNAVDNNADISRCGIYVEHEDEESKRDIFSNVNMNMRQVVDDRRFLCDVIRGGYLSGVVWNKVYNFSKIKSCRFMTSDGLSEDIMFNNRVANKISSCVYEDNPKYHYLKRLGALTGSEFNYNAFSIVEAKEHFLEQYASDKELYPLCVYSYVESAFIVLSGVIEWQRCLDRYDYLRNGILRFKRQIFTQKEYSWLCKLKTFLLYISPKLYNKILTKIKFS